MFLISYLRPYLVLSKPKFTQKSASLHGKTGFTPTFTMFVDGISARNRRQLRYHQRRRISPSIHTLRRNGFTPNEFFNNSRVPHREATFWTTHARLAVEIISIFRLNRFFRSLYLEASTKRRSAANLIQMVRASSLLYFVCCWRFGCTDRDVSSSKIC